MCVFSGYHQLWSLSECRLLIVLSLSMRVNLFPFSTVSRHNLLLRTIFAPLSWVLW